MSQSEIDYSKIDENIRNLIRVLNTFESVRTTESCGGHAEPGSAGLPAGQYFVSLEIVLDGLGLQNLQFLSWCINSEFRQPVCLRPISSPEQFGEPELRLYLEGEGDPDRLADFLEDCRQLFTLTDDDDDFLPQAG